MKRQYYKQIMSATLLAVLGVAFGATNTFATDTNYGIDYSGGEILGENNNVQENATLINGLSSLIKNNEVTTAFNGTGWETGYFKDDGDGNKCKPMHYFEVLTNSTDNGNNLSATMSNNDYRAEIVFKGASVEDRDYGEFGEKTMVGIADNFGWIYGGWEIYTDSVCTNKNTDLSRVLRGNARLFVNTEIKLYRKNQSTPLLSNGLYFGLTDIDAAQSYKILNTYNMLSPDNMYAADLDGLQDPGETLRNKFVPQNDNSEGYIYSEYNDGVNPIALEGTSNIFVKLKEETQEEGLNLVFGFANNAASGIEYYAKQYTVNYEADDNGEITGQRSESVIAGQNPTGSEATPDTNYAFNYWTADVQVVIDGETIPAGTILTDDDILAVEVDKDITFTAYFVNQYTVTYDSDDNGSITGQEEEAVNENDNPAGTEQKSNDGYILSYWIADTDVVLEDGTEIKEGDPITTEQIKQVVVTKNINFTAIHAPKVATPDTGTISKGADAAQIATISLLGILACGLVIKFLPRALHKKVNFDK